MTATLEMILQSMSDAAAGRTSQGPVDQIPLAQGPDGVDIPETPSDIPDAPGAGDPAAQPAPATTGTYAWGDYENGRIPASALKRITGGGRLEASAADAWDAMAAAAHAAGITLRATDSYRSYDQQVAVRKTKGHLVATATPGTSVHGWGRAVDADVNDPSTLVWLRANGPRFGWNNPAWAQAKGKNHEPWHWQYDGTG